MRNERSYIKTHKVYPVDEIPAFILESLTFPNPEYAKKLRMGHSVQGVPEYYQLFEEKGGFIYIPRSLDINLPVDDDFRSKGHPAPMKFKGKPREYQYPAIAALVDAEGGILNAGCGTGKTVMSLAAIAEVGTTTLVLVHKEFLMNQWVDNIREFLGEEAGIIRGDTWDYKGKKIVVGMLQTLHARRDKLPPDLYDYFGLVVSDEVHRVAADTWQSVLTSFPAYRRWGLTATIERTDGLQTVFLAHIGPVVHKVKAKELKPQVVKVGMNYEFDVKPYRNRYGKKDINISRLVTAITQIPQRNNLILNMTMQAAMKGRKIIVFSERRAHLEEMNEAFNKVAAEHDLKGGLYIGGMKQDLLDETAETCDVLFATYHIAKEALDIPELDTCVFASPVSNPITIQQGVGRITRQHEAKRDPLVIDFVDNNIEIFQRMFHKRCTIYKKLEYPVITAGDKNAQG